MFFDIWGQRSQDLLQQWEPLIYPYSILEYFKASSISAADSKNCRKKNHSAFLHHTYTPQEPWNRQGKSPQTPLKKTFLQLVHSGKPSNALHAKTARHWTGVFHRPRSPCTTATFLLFLLLCSYTYCTVHVVHIHPLAPCFFFFMSFLYYL